MRGWLAELALILLAGAVFAAATSVAFSAAWPALAAWLRRLAAPAPRAWVALAVALAPALVAVALVAICLAPGLAAPFGSHGDHCLAHTEHPHLCLTHHGALSAPLSALLIAAAAISLGVLVRLAVQLVHARRRGVILERASAGRLAPGVTLVHSARPFSLAAGLLRPHIWISTALVDALESEQLAVVLAHERGHVRRRDALCRWAAAACSLPLWPSVRRALLAELSLASEQACDEAAVVRVSDRLHVAETLLAVERLLGSGAGPAEPAGVLAFGGSTVPERVRSLLAGPPAAVSLRYAALAALGVPVVAALGADRIHHATEHLLGALLRLF